MIMITAMMIKCWWNDDGLNKRTKENQQNAKVPEVDVWWIKHNEKHKNEISHLKTEPHGYSHISYRVFWGPSTLVKMQVHIQ
jgi:hypothetical protein